MEKVANASLNPVDFLSKAWKVYKKLFVVLIGISLVPVILLGLGIVLGLGGLLVFTSESIGAYPFTYTFGVIALISVCLMFIAYLWSYVAMLVVIRDRAKKVTILGAFKSSSSFIIPKFWIAILVGLIEMGGFILLIIPGVIFAVWFMFSDLILVAEGKRGLEALLKSKEYVKGYWWKLFWVIFFFGIFSIIISAGLGYVLTVIAVNLNIPPVGEQLINIFFIPFAATYMFLIYEEMKKIKGPMKFNIGKNEKLKWSGMVVFGGILLATLFIGFAYLMAMSL